MFRNSLVSARKLLTPKFITFKLTSEAYGPGSTAVYDVRRTSHERHSQRRILLPLDQSFFTSRQLMISARQSMLPSRNDELPVGNTLFLHDSRVLLSFRQASTGFRVPNVTELACNFLNMSRCIDFKDLRDAPPPVLWTSFSTSAVQLGFPFLELVGGYSPTLTYLQLYIAAMSLAWNAGEKWGLALSNNPKLKPDWDTMRWALTPVGIAVTGLVLPYPLGFLAVTTGLLTSLYGDLKACAYPPWSVAANALVTLSSSIGLLLALMAYVLFNNRENSKNKEDDAKSVPLEGDDGKDDDEASKKRVPPS